VNEKEGVSGAKPWAARVSNGLRIEPLDEGRIVRLLIDRPDRGNSLTPPLLSALENAVRSLPGRGARSAILTGAGERSFSTGYDVSALQSELSAVLADGAEQPFDPATHPLERALAAITASPVPIVAAIRGTAIGAGFELAAACDLRVIGKGARFLMPPAKLGIVYSASGMARIQALIGAGAVRELFYLAEQIDAPRAVALGLATGLCEDSAVPEAALETARRLAALAPLAIAGMKRILERHLASPRIDAAAQAEIDAIRVGAFRSADLCEGVTAFLEQRAPRFEGK
jgi:enoyl-CoA hydratase/carnithine racemase